MSAFTNDFDDLGGGYILASVDSDDDTGVAIRPAEGVHAEKIDGILQEMVGYNNKISPYDMSRTSIEEVDGRRILVIWCPVGIPFAVSAIRYTIFTAELSYTLLATDTFHHDEDLLL